MTDAGPDRPAGSPPPPGPIRKWWLGARPRTLPAALVPVAGRDGRRPPAPSSGDAARPGLVDHPRPGLWWRALGALVVALAIQIGTNYANDYSDGIRGTDDARVGPVRLSATGLASPAAVKRAALLAFAVAGVAGLALAWATSWWISWSVRPACWRRLVLHRWTPALRVRGTGRGVRLRLLRTGGDGGTFYVADRAPRPTRGVVAAVPVGLLATALLLANNLRDIASDLESGKRTLAVRVGRRPGGWCYVGCVGAPSRAWPSGVVLVVTG